MTRKENIKSKKIKMKALAIQEIIQSKIFFIRGKKVMLARDLAILYEVPTYRLNEQVKRNIKRFPEDFMFRLTSSEKEEVIAICDNLKTLKYSPVLPIALISFSEVFLRDSPSRAESPISTIKSN